MLYFKKFIVKINYNLRCYLYSHRDVDHPGKDMGALYAQDVQDICDKLSSKGEKPSCFIAESLQSCGGTDENNLITI